MILHKGDKKPNSSNLSKSKTNQKKISRLLNKKLFVRISGFIVMALLVGVTSLQLLNTLKNIIPSKPSLANNCPAGYTWNGTQCEQRTAKVAGTPVCPAGYIDNGQIPPCITTVDKILTCPAGFGLNSNTFQCERATPYSTKCFSGDLPDVSNNCGYQQMPLFDCGTNRTGQSQIFDSTSGYNNPGLKLCSMTPQYFATGSCPGIFDANNAFTYTNIAWLDDWTGSVYNNGDRLDAIMNYQNRVPGGSSNTGQFMSDRFCAVSDGTGANVQYYGNGCPANFRALLDKGSRTHALTFPSNDLFNYSPNPLNFLCVNKSFADGSLLGSVPNISVVHGGVGDSVVRDRFCGPNEIGQTWDGFGKTAPYYPSGAGHNDRTRICSAFTYQASVLYCSTGNKGSDVGMPQYQCYEVVAPFTSCPAGYTLSTGSICEQTAEKVAGIPVCPSGYTDDGGNPPCVIYIAEVVCASNQYFNTTSFTCKNINIFSFPTTTNPFLFDTISSCDIATVESTTTCHFTLQPETTIIGANITMIVGLEPFQTPFGLSGGTCVQTSTDYNTLISVICTDVPTGRQVGTNIYIYVVKGSSSASTLGVATLTPRPFNPTRDYPDFSQKTSLTCTPQPALVTTSNGICNGTFPAYIVPPSSMQIRISDGAVTTCSFNIGSNPNAFQCINIGFGTVAGTFPFRIKSDSEASFTTIDKTTIINGAGTDTDGDGMPDLWENQYGLDPNNPADAALDLDNDGLTNLQEYTVGTNPRVADTDGDGMPDGYEVTNGLNPLVNDASGDLDNDGLTNLQEYTVGT
ncbi:MAG: hypothetical protein H7196_03995, partial [candidate division SR1 bacterium]|nr:hypothetical protein [candidate division SR1 bacterium]